MAMFQVVPMEMQFDNVLLQLPEDLAFEESNRGDYFHFLSGIGVCRHEGQTALHVVNVFDFNHHVTMRVLRALIGDAAYGLLVVMSKANMQAYCQNPDESLFRPFFLEVDDTIYENMKRMLREDSKHAQWLMRSS